MHLSSKAKIGLLATFTTLSAFALSTNAVPPLATTIAREFGIDYVNFGYIFMLQFVCFAIGSVAGGWAAHRFGFSSRSLIIFGLFMVGIILPLGSLLPNFSWFVAWAIPLGFMGGLVETFSAIMICSYSGTHSSKTMNLGQVFYCLGATCGPMIIGGMLAYDFSWQMSFLILGITILITGVVFVLFTRGDFGCNRLTSSQTCEAEEAATKKLSLHRDKLLYLMAGSLFMYVCVESSIVCWVAAYFEKFFLLPASAAAGRLSLFWFSMIGGRVLMIFVPVRWTLWPSLFVGSAGMFITTLLLCFNFGEAAASAIVAISAFISGPLWPVIVTISQKLRESGGFTSVVIAAGGLGAAAGPLMSSLIIQYFGMRALFPAVSIGVIFLFISLIFANSLANKQTK